MIHKHSLKVLSNLALLLVLFTGQVAATPSSSVEDTKENFYASPDELLPSSILPSTDMQDLSNDTTRISGTAGGSSPSISMDGRYVAFESSGNIVIRDTHTNTNVTVGSGSHPSISADGLHVAFESSGQIMVYDMLNDFSVAIGSGSSPSISASGQFVAFESSGYIRVHNNLDNSDKTAFTPSTGLHGKYGKLPSISANGKHVVFVVTEDNTIDSYIPTDSDIFVRNLTNNSITQIYQSVWEGPSSDTAWGPSISADGRYITYKKYIRDESGGFSAFMREYWLHDMHNPPGVDTLVYSLPGGNDHFEDSRYGPTNSISADGRYIAFSIKGIEWAVYVYDTTTNLVTQISVTPDGTSPNGFSYYPSISADGQYVAFASDASNLVDGDTNGTTDVFVHGIYPKPPLILVHGWQGLNFGGGFNCTGDPAVDVVPYDDNSQNSTLNSEVLGSRGIAEMFKEKGFDVWIAHLETSPSYTPPLQKNGECLRDQIEYVASQNSWPMTVVAHSMGGLVSRNAIRRLDPSIVEVNALYTMGSPHVGIPTEVVAALIELGLPGVGAGVYSGLCIVQPAGCQMTPTYMNVEYNWKNKNLPKVKYNFITGDGGDNKYLAPLWYYAGGFSPNDGFVGVYSGVGWVHPFQAFIPDDWTNASSLGQYVTNETHPAGSNPAKAYYTAQDNTLYSDSFSCIWSLMNDEPPNTGNCESAQQYQVFPPSQQKASIIDTVKGKVPATQTETVSLVIDGEGATSIVMAWMGENPPILTVTTPSGEFVDSSYATLHPELVNYETFDGSSVSLPYVVYRFSTGQPGAWQLSITATDEVDYQIMGLLEDNERTLVISTDSDTYQISDTATITAVLENNGIGLPSATVIANVARSDEIVDTLTLTDPENDGTYTASYTIPDAPGFLIIDITASGDDNGVAYTRQKPLIVNIAPNDLHLAGNYADVPNDDNADGFYEYLDFNVGVNADATAEYDISAELYAGDQLVTHAADYFDLVAGAQTVTLRFDGSAIRESGLDGPYTIKNLYATPLDIGIPAVDVTDVFTTSAYTYTQFGRHACYTLTADHIGEGLDPVVWPSHSDGCYANEFTPGVFIDLTASPSGEWSVGSWSGTIADSSTAARNFALMPDNQHTITVRYIDPAVSWNTFLGGNGSDLGYSIVRDAAGYIYVSGSSSESWGSPIRAYSGTGSGGDDVFVAKLTAEGQLVWNTFLGGASLDRYGYDMAVDDAGDIYVTGYSEGTWGNPQIEFSGTRDAFVAKLSSSGNLIWSNFLGGSSGSQGGGIDVRDGSVYVAGASNTSWGNPIHAHTAGNDGFAAKLDATSGSLNWNTFFGGSGEDLGYVLHIDANGNSYISGYGNSAWGDPVRGFTDGSNDGFLTKFDPSGNMVWNTFLGGIGDDLAYQFDLDENENLYLAGRSTTTWGDPVNGYSGGARDGFVTKINANTGALIWNSFVGGSGDDFVWNIGLDGNGYIKVAGASDITWGSPIVQHTNGYDAFYAKLNVSGGLLGNTFVGGTGTDKAYGMLLGSSESAYLFGYSDTSWGSPLRAYTAGNDNFVAKVYLNNLPLIVSSVTRDAASPTNASSVSYTVNFSEPVTGVDASDFTLTTSGVTGAAISGVSGSGSTYIVTVNTGTGSGTIRLDVVANGSIMNSVSNSLARGFTLGQTFTIAITPTITPTATAASSTPTRTATVTATPTKTATPTRTGTPTKTATPTRTATVTATSTKTATPTRTGTSTRTATPTRTATATGTSTKTATPTRTGTSTNTATPSRTATATATNTPVLPGCMSAPFNINLRRPEISGTDFHLLVENKNAETAYLTGSFITWPTWPGMTFGLARFNGNTFYNPVPDVATSPVITDLISIPLYGNGTFGDFRVRFSGTVIMNGVFSARLTFNIPSLGTCYAEAMYPSILTPTQISTLSSTSTP